MNEFIKNAIVDRLRELNEEKESIDSTITSLEEKLKELKQKQGWMAKTISETQEFLNVNKAQSNTAATQKVSKKSKSG